MADIFNLTDTWNNAGTTFNAIKMNVTNTASGAQSRLLELEVAGARKFDVRADGLVAAPLGIASHSDAISTFAIDPTQIVTSNNGQIGWGAAFGVIDPMLVRDASATIAQRNSTNPQTFRVYNTYTDAANYERGVFDWSTTPNTLTIGTQKAGTGTDRDITLRPATGIVNFASLGSQVVQVGVGTYNGEFTIVAGAAGYFNGNNVAIQLKNSGRFVWTNAATNDGNSTYDAGLARPAAGIVEVNNGTAGTGAALKCATIRRSVPVTKTADFAVADTDSYIICNKGSAGVITLPAASTCPGREISFTNIQAFAWTSASSNVVPRVGGSAGNAILAATDGAWCKLVSDGTNWINLQGTP